eukprot:8280670-Prorocentrum_lima.AAC.1
MFFAAFAMPGLSSETSAVGVSSAALFLKICFLSQLAWPAMPLVLSMSSKQSTGESTQANLDSARA